MKEVPVNRKETTKSPQMQMKEINIMSQVVGSALTNFISIKSRFSLENKIWLVLQAEGKCQRCEEWNSEIEVVSVIITSFLFVCLFCIFW